MILKGRSLVEPCSVCSMSFVSLMLCTGFSKVWFSDLGDIFKNSFPGCFSIGMTRPPVLTRFNGCGAASLTSPGSSPQCPPDWRMLWAQGETHHKEVSGNHHK